MTEKKQPESREIYSIGFNMLCNCDRCQLALQALEAHNQKVSLVT